MNNVLATVIHKTAIQAYQTLWVQNLFADKFDNFWPLECGKQSNGFSVRFTSTGDEEELSNKTAYNLLASGNGFQTPWRRNLWPAKLI